MSAAYVRGLNHVTLAVTDLAISLTFYRDLLGFRVAAEWADGAYLEAGSLWLCLSVDEAIMARPRPDYTHLALTSRPKSLRAWRPGSRAPRGNRSEAPSLYFLDPDGHKLELHAGTLESRLEHYRRHPRPGLSIHDE